jgi:hypothetical protein
MARFDTRSWGNGGELVLGGSMAHSKEEDKEGKRRERKEGNGSHGGAVV